MSEATKSRTPLMLGALAVVIALAIVIAVLLSSGTTKKHASSSTTTSSTTTIPYNIKYNARQDASEGSCLQKAGRWVITGGLINSGSVNRKYQILVDFVTPTGGTVEDSATLEVAKLKPGKQLNWTLSSKTGIASANCVITSVLGVPIR